MNVHTTTGKVSEVSGNSIVIDHEAIVSLGWPAMAMTFKAPDSTAISALTPGIEVKFSFRQEGNDYVLKEITTR